MDFSLAIGGNIGAGKTTLIDAFARLESAEFLLAPEPADQNPFLEASYRDPFGFKCMAQMWFLSSRLLAQRSLPDVGVVYDRHLLEDPVFARLNYEYFTDEQKQLYELHREAVMFDVKLPHVYVRLDAAPAVCLERIRRRGIESEVQAITLDYLERLHALYEDFWREVSEICLVVKVDAGGSVDASRLWAFIENVEKKPGTVEFQ